MPVKKTTGGTAATNARKKSEQPDEQKKTPFQIALDEMAAYRAKYKTVPVEAQEYGSDGQPRAKLSWLLEALDAIIGLRGAYWSVEYSHEEIIDAGGGEKLCSLKAVISKHISDTANNYVGVGYGSAMLVERVAANTYKKHLDAWDVAQEKALAAAARFFEIGMELEAPPENLGRCDNSVFSERLRYFREYAKLNQKELAEKVGIPFQTYNNYETKGNEPKIEILIKLANALGVDVNTLVGFEEKGKTMPADNAINEPTKNAPDPEEKEKALAELRGAVKKFHYQNVIIKIVQFKYGAEKVESLPPALLRDLKENMVLYHQEWQEALKREAAAHGDHKRTDN